MHTYRITSDRFIRLRVETAEHVVTCSSSGGTGNSRVSTLYGSRRRRNNLQTHQFASTPCMFIHIPDR